MSSFVLPLVLSLGVFCVIRLIFRLEQHVQVQVDAIMIGLYTALYAGGVGLVGGDLTMACLNMMGVLTSTFIYRSAIGWPSGRVVLQAFRRQQSKYIPTEDDPKWLEFNP